MQQVQPVIQYERSGSTEWVEPKYSSRITPDGKEMEIIIEVPVDRDQTPPVDAAEPSSSDFEHHQDEDWAEMTGTGERWVNNSDGKRNLVQPSSDAQSVALQHQLKKDMTGGQQVQNMAKSHTFITKNDSQGTMSQDYVRQIAATLATYKRQLGEDP